MEALEIESQTDQAPLASGGLNPAQRELAKAEYLFDDANHRFDGAFACPVDRFAQRSSELVGHLDLRTGILRRWIWQGREALLPTWMVRITTRGDIWLNLALGTGSQCCEAKIASIHRRCLRSANLRGNGSERGFGFLAIIGVIGKRTPYD